jgi:hypothetical protein
MEFDWDAENKKHIGLHAVQTSAEKRSGSLPLTDEQAAGSDLLPREVKS